MQDIYSKAINNYLTNHPIFSKLDLEKDCPWLRYSPKLMNELVSFWLDNHMVKQQADTYIVTDTGNNDFIIFLDIDGVLNYPGSEGIDNECLNNLKILVNKFNAKIILISSWKSGWFKEDKNLQSEDANYLDKKLASAGLKIEDKPSRYAGDRVFEIVDTLMRYNTNRFIILEDELFHYKNTPLNNNLILCKNKGLTLNLIEFYSHH